ncbi:ABC transporter permease [Citrobacter portucalensis]|uniref:Transport permease protein n=1 Tax=Salmonella enterica subsp. enterica serovar Agona TaxID=58095 RepID=A0A5V6M5A7_SALET|nr:ABC transporter permease [Salmonella enterica]EBU7984345.1 ABC transporter permease [Salmonella enterica subsp. enterica serovar Agona]ECZ9067984.1 ABC transporter permease [Salmonella enterica subsp. enterica serovar Derby]EKN4012787.1 ABC transporter permease [Yersinia enterocolitica]HBZ0096241.1 ABC transporter permease [Klebsiella pneumoniae]
MKNSTFRSRLISLTRKETRQLLRDKSNLAVGLLLPVVLILLFGYGLSFDLSNARIGVVQEQRTPQSWQIVTALQGSRYLSVQEYTSFNAAQDALRKGKTDAILRIPSDFAQRLTAGNAQLQLIVNGASTSVASAAQGYVTGALATQSAVIADRGGNKPSGGSVTVEQRMWLNESGNSTWFIVPGLVVLILTLIGAFLTGLLIARERERGTLEALFVTPVRPLELVLAKLAPYMVIGTIDLVVCLLASHYLFDVPIRGSLWAIIVSSLLYLLVSLGLGLTISGFAPGQFLASQVALIASFMPAMMLSGFVFDTRNLPVVIQVISQILPATHFMSLIKTLFLGGDDWKMFFKECGILSLYALVLINASRISLRKRLR